MRCLQVSPDKNIARRAGEVRSVKIELNPQRASALGDQYETTTASVLLAVWQTLLWRLTQRPIVVGNVCEGRSYELLNDAFGLFARALPVQAPFTDGLSFAEVIAQITAQEREAAEWQDYFEFDQTTDGKAHFTFGYEHIELLAAQNARGAQISILHLSSSIERFSLKLLSISRPAKIELAFEYDAAEFSEASIRQIAGQFETLLDVALTNPESFG